MDEEQLLMESVAQRLGRMGCQSELFHDRNIEYGIKYSLGDGDLTMRFILRAFPTMAKLTLEAELSFLVPRDKYGEFCLAIALVNRSLQGGSFELDFKSGAVMFEILLQYGERDLNMDDVDELIRDAAKAIDKYSRKLRALSRGELPVSAFGAE